MAEMPDLECEASVVSGLVRENDKLLSLDRVFSSNKPGKYLNSSDKPHVHFLLVQFDAKVIIIRQLQTMYTHDHKGRPLVLLSYKNKSGTNLSTCSIVLQDCWETLPQ